MRKEKKSSQLNKVIGVILTLLLLSIAVFTYLNSGNLAPKKELQLQAQFLLTSGTKKEQVGLADLLAVGLEEFEAIMTTSTTAPKTIKLTGVELSKLLDHYSIAISNQSIIQVTALDGYASALSGAEVLAIENVYLCLYLDGEPLKTKQEGGQGPYWLVIRNDQFAQRWCKFVEEIMVK